MRMIKILVAAAVAVASVTLGTTAGPAHAQGETSYRAGFGWYDVKTVDNNTLVAKGKANNWRRKIVLIQRAPKNGHRWTTVARDRTDGEGRFKTRLQARRDIPCNGRQYKTRAKKQGRAQWIVDDTLWSC